MSLTKCWETFEHPDRQGGDGGLQQDQDGAQEARSSCPWSVVPLVHRGVRLGLGGASQDAPASSPAQARRGVGGVREDEAGQDAK